MSLPALSLLVQIGPLVGLGEMRHRVSEFNCGRRGLVQGTRGYPGEQAWVHCASGSPGRMGGRQTAGVSGEEPSGRRRGTPRSNVEYLMESFNWSVCLGERNPLTAIYGATLELDKVWRRGFKGEGRARPQSTRHGRAHVTALRPRSRIHCVFWGSRRTSLGCGQWSPPTSWGNCETSMKWYILEALCKSYVKVCSTSSWVVLIICSSPFQTQVVPCHSLLNFSTPPLKEFMESERSADSQQLTGCWLEELSSLSQCLVILPGLEDSEGSGTSFQNTCNRKTKQI